MPEMLQVNQPGVIRSIGMKSITAALPPVTRFMVISAKHKHNCSFSYAALSFENNT